jgi:hypothetical protein
MEDELLPRRPAAAGAKVPPPFDEEREARFAARDPW